MRIYSSIRGKLDIFSSFIHCSRLLDFSPEDYIDTESPVPPDPEQPDCTKILELPYSIHAFQHLRVSREIWDFFFFLHFFCNLVSCL